MGTPMIRVEHISKEYRLGVIGQKMRRDRTESGLQTAQTPTQRHDGRRNEKEMLTALSDIFFEAEAGKPWGSSDQTGRANRPCSSSLQRLPVPAQGGSF